MHQCSGWRLFWNKVLATRSLKKHLENKIYCYLRLLANKYPALKLWLSVRWRVRKGKEFSLVRAVNLWNVERVKPLATLRKREERPCRLLRPTARVVFVKRGRVWFLYPGVLVPRDCHNKRTILEGLNNRNALSRRTGGEKSQTKEAAELVLSESCEGESAPRISPGFWWFTQKPGVPWLVSAKHQASHYTVPVSLCPEFFFL